jgi:hypothetical protein
VDACSGARAWLVNGMQEARVSVRAATSERTLCVSLALKLTGSGLIGIAQGFVDPVSQSTP